MCRFFTQGKACPFGDECNYAHGRDQLKQRDYCNNQSSHQSIHAGANLNVGQNQKHEIQPAKKSNNTPLTDLSATATEVHSSERSDVGHKNSVVEREVDESQSSEELEESK